MGLKCHLDTGKQKFLMSLYFDKNAQTPQNDTVNSWRVKVTVFIGQSDNIVSIKQWGMCILLVHCGTHDDMIG